MSGPVRALRVFVHRHRRPAALLSGAYAASTLAAGMFAGEDGAQSKAWAALFCVLAAGAMFLLVKGCFILTERLTRLSGARMGDVVQIFFIFIVLFQFALLGFEYFRSFSLLYVPVFGALEGVFLGCIFRRL